LHIKTASFIFSWDNLASKGRMAANFDYYLVWSDLMKTELQQFYGTVKKEHIQVVGTPQFEPYVLERYKVSKEEFVLKFNIDASLKTICFSCGDISTSKNDELYIETIANALLERKIQNVNLIVRTSPAEDPIRFASFVERFSFIKWNYPKWNLSRQGHQEVWSQRIPSVEDVKDLRSLLEFSDLNINMLSTMSLDFIQFDKPVINTVFGNAVNGLYNDQRFLNYAHIVNVVTSNATKIVKNQEELIAAINLYLKEPNLDSQNREQLLQLQVSKPLVNTGKRIAESLVKWT
jgi:CDP-glycerol glycerophosphotransferase (TagB/SpsB family)